MNKDYCPNCGNKLTPSQIREAFPRQKIQFYYNNNSHNAVAIQYNDAFMEIVEGQFKGCLVHTWNIIK